MTAAKVKLATSMRNAKLAGVSDALLLEASAPPQPEEEEEEQDEEEEEDIEVNGLKIGDRAEIFGLESESGKLMNGQAGRISSYFKDKGRFNVALGPGKFVSIKPENLKKVASAPASSGSASIEIGDRVEVWGLESDAGKKMNGYVGITVEFVEDKGRWKIQLPNKEMISVRPVNLQLVKRKKDLSSSEDESSEDSGPKAKKAKKSSGVNPEEALEAMLKGETVKKDKKSRAARDEGAAAAKAAAAAAAQAAAAQAAVDENTPLKLGDKVEVFGLQSASGKALNGKSGLLTKFDATKGRFQVELGMANLQSLKPENLRRVARSKTGDATGTGTVSDGYLGSSAGYTLL